MPFCAQCGTPIDGRFCSTCGAAAPAQAAAPPPDAVPPPVPSAVPSAPAPQLPPALPPPTAQSAPAAVPQAAAQPAVQGAAPARKSRALVWGLVGCLGVVVIGVVILVATGMFLTSKAKQAGFDADLMKKNPALATAKMLATANPDVEVVSVNEDKGTLTVREKATGKTLTMNLDDLKNGKMVFTDDRGERVTIQSGGEGGRFSVKTKDGTVEGGSTWTPPAWLPAYPGARVQTGANSQSAEEDAGAAYLSTQDSPDAVLVFYEEALKKQGFEAVKQVTASDGKNEISSVTATRDAGGKYVHVVAMPMDGATTIYVSYTAKK